tara:strand:+ start:609 stop:833 length:225 start_codon:yes stop_codon:yes gene_type:complete
MSNNNLNALGLAAVLCLFSFGAGFLVGKHHEQNSRDYFNFRYDRDGLIIDGRQNNEGRVRVWPFVDVEYEREKE